MGLGGQCDGAAHAGLLGDVRAQRERAGIGDRLQRLG